VLTYEAYLAEDPVEGRYDIIDGTRIPLPGQSLKHQEVVVRLLIKIARFALESRRGQVLTAPLDVIIRRDPLRTRQPDVFFITNERLAEIGGPPSQGVLTVGPELIIEVLSPSETARSVRAKLTDLAGVGVREAWLVSPEAETVQVLRLTPETMETAATYGYDQTVISEAIAGLTVPVAQIFED
jgi:Uma2 family endonuclease